ncbi:Hypothetical protein P9303_20601 [Prochlorococcus marinus str. MIT 9303]|uniref:Uncharacterized protein n=1 Tax=Prochlorococcus marinus (strain MIT 9303) TaxID=59922 RepID=A2CBD6_PROM3|nr:Hypothetical protein P9303_20601 [Prochlorococcus marinus str. MIT 9303]
MSEVPLMSMSMSASWLNQQLTCWQRDQAFCLVSNQLSPSGVLHSSIRLRKPLLG